MIPSRRISGKAALLIMIARCEHCQTFPGIGHVKVSCRTAPTARVIQSTLSSTKLQPLGVCNSKSTTNEGDSQQNSTQRYPSPARSKARNGPSPASARTAKFGCMIPCEIPRPMLLRQDKHPSGAEKEMPLFAEPSPGPGLPTATPRRRIILKSQDVMGNFA
jgi:hypothetical protein